MADGQWPPAAAEELSLAIYSYYKSVCLKLVVDLGVPDALHRLGGRATSDDLHSALSLPPERLRDFARLMRAGATAGFFSTAAVNGETICYELNPVSRLLVAGDASLSPLVSALLQPQHVAPCFASFSEWFRAAAAAPATAFEMTHGATMWELAARDAGYNAAFNAGMACGSRLLVAAVLGGHRHVFAGVTTLVDVGGGVGTIAVAIAEAFPEMKSSVLDLPHVVAAAPAGGRVEFIAGDMFVHIPPADALLLKGVLHDWDDKACIKILERCREMIPAEGKVILLERVVSGPLDHFLDLEMMSHTGGLERDEQEWKQLFTMAGFSRYKISSVLGSRSIIEVFP